MKMGLKQKILIIGILPVLILGVAAINVSLTIVKSSLINEIKDSLKGTATATLAAYDQNPGDYLQTENGDVWKGGYNISKSETLVDNIKERSRMDVTFFYGEDRIMTSAKDKNGMRILGSPAGQTVVEKVLNKGEEFFSHNVSIDGVLNYGYYIPVYQQEGAGKPVGMIFVGANKAEKDAVINKMLYIIIAVVQSIMIIAIIVSVIFASNITKALKESMGYVESVAKGELGIEIDEKLLNRKDDIGGLSSAILSLKTELQSVLKKVAESAQVLTQASDKLQTMAKDTNVTMKQVEQAVTDIAESASEQADSTKNTSDNIMLMGEQIGKTSEEVNTLNKNADIMRTSSEQAAVTIRQLRKINDEVEQSIDTITRQTNQTNESAKKIQAAIEIISSIAEETNLLSLNASIEAARAGESGRGFAVVAASIQKLAEQSNESSNTIEEITHALMADSDIAVDTMKHVKEIIDNQSRNMQETESIVEEVTKGINVSLKSIEQIEKTTVMLEQSRNKIVDTVGELSDIAQRNASGTVQTCSRTTEVAGTFEQIADSALALEKVADEIVSSMQHFHL